MAAVEPRKRVITIEFLEDGLTAFGNVWEKGQRKSIEKDTRDWTTTVNRRGEDSWLLLSQKGQVERWGKVYFRRLSNVDLDTESKGEDNSKE